MKSPRVILVLEETSTGISYIVLPLVILTSSQFHVAAFTQVQITLSPPDSHPHTTLYRVRESLFW